MNPIANKNAKIGYEAYLDKVYGCFLGKTVVGTLGAPFEGIKMPLELEFRREMIDAMLPNDDLDLQVLWLDVVEKRGEAFTSYDLLKQFCECCSYSPGEYATMRKNYERGIYPPLSGLFSNDFYLNGMGSPIRSEIWACLAPLDPVRAADYAERDGILDHAGDSVHGERFFAALEAAAFTESNLDKLIGIGLSVVPEHCRFRELVEDTVALCARYADGKTVLRKILFKYGHPDCTNLYQNVGITLTALLKGNLDLIKTGMDALNCGFDTDCTCATAGAVIGMIRGAKDLISSYALGDVRFILGVTSHRRSDRVVDLSEDVALLGACLSPDTVTGAPKKEFAFAPAQYPLAFSVGYRENDPTFYPGKPCELTLTVKNRSAEPIKDTLTLTGRVFSAALPLSLAAGGEEKFPLTVAFPEEESTVYDKNIIAVKNGAGVPIFSFGVVGAMPWKAIGPIWRTDPVCDTASLLAAGLAYRNIIHAVPYDGERKDVTRRFHLNCCPDTETEFISPEDCFTPPSDADTYEETVFYQKNDSFRMEDITGFSGPSVVYLARELVCDTDREVFFQIGHSAPFALYLNGEKLAERKNCDTWDAENVHLSGVRLRAGVNRLVWRLTRVNADAKYNLIISDGAACATHYVDFGAVRPERW